MPNLVRLSETFAPLRGESLLGFLLRICGANSISPQEFCSEIIGRSRDLFASLASLPEYALSIARSTGLTESQILEMMHIDAGCDTTLAGRTIPCSQLDRSHRRIAPARLRQDKIPFHRVLWSVRLLACDPSSGEMVVDRCTCGTRLVWWQAGSLTECSSCRALLTDLEPRYGSAEQIAVCRFWAGLFSSRPEVVAAARASLPPPFGRLSTADLIRAASHLDIVGSGKPTSSFGGGVALMQSWPKCLEDMTPTARVVANRSLSTLFANAA